MRTESTALQRRAATQRRRRLHNRRRAIEERGEQERLRALVLLEQLEQANQEQANEEQTNHDQANEDQTNGEEANQSQLEQANQANQEQTNHDQANEDQTNGEEANQEQENQTNTCFSNADMNHMKILEKKWETNDKEYNIATSLDSAILAYYSNCGFTRFDEHRSYSASQHNQDIDVDSIVDEISKERLNDTEMEQHMRKYHKAYDFNSPLYACGACGIRRFEGRNGSSSIRFDKRPISTLPDIYRYDDSQVERLNRLRKAEVIKVPHVANASVMISIQPWKLVSHFVSVEEEEIYHLHQELVETDDSGVHHVMLCPRCSSAASKGECYKLSIANGIDFGNHDRLKGITPPNLHEQLIISKYRLYSAVIKVLPNGKGFQRNRGMNWMRGNQIMFAHDAPYKSNHETLSEEELENMFTVNFFDENGKNDQMAKRAYGTSKLYARPAVLRQWFALLSQTSEQYADITSATVEEVIRKTEKVTKRKKDSPLFISDRTSLNHEKALGSDVAAVQQIDPRTSGYNEEDSSRHQRITDDELPLRTHFVTRSPESLLRDDHVMHKVRKEGLSKILDPEGGETEETFQSTSHTYDETNTDEARSEIFQEPKPAETGHQINSTRGSDPLSEFHATDDLLTGAFPWLFPLGTAYGKASGNLNAIELDHLLRQFHLLHSKDRRLLGYLADVQRRLEVIRKAKYKLSGNQDAIDKVNEFMERDDHEEILQKLKDNPKSKEAKAIWKKFKPVLSLIGGNVLYGALESSRCVSQIMETAKRYGPGCTFLTLSLDDLFNSRAIRTAIKSVDNNTFPAVFGEHTTFPSLQHLLASIRHHAVDHGEGNIDLDIGPGTRFERSYLSRLASENPIAYVSETKAIINHVLSILIGCPVEGFFGAFDGKSTRKTPFWKTKKGIFGHILSFCGVVEDHVKGTLHFHIILFGSITTYVLQQLSQIDRICAEVARTLDTFYTARFSTKTNSRNILSRILRKASAFGKLKEGRNVPPLLKRHRPLSIFDDSENNLTGQEEVQEELEDGQRTTGEHNMEQHQTGMQEQREPAGSENNQTGQSSTAEHSTGQHLITIQEQGEAAVHSNTGERTIKSALQKMNEETEEERACNCFHEHHTTCHKGHRGKTCCRFARASGVCDCTCCVFLQPNEEKRDKKDRDDIPDYKATKRDTQQNGTYHLRNPLDRDQVVAQNNLAVWELERPSVILETIEGFDCTIQAPSDAINMDDNTLRRGIIHNFQVLLKDEPDEIEHVYDGSSELWISLRDESIEKVKCLYFEFINCLKRANQYCVEHSVPLFYCTGSHNNATLLGGLHQAKAAMFYIAPYMSKEKATLSVCLTALEKARTEVTKYPSRAKDRDARPEERRAKHFLTRVVNKLHAYTELSDYQVAAYLLKLPSILTSETFGYTETYGAINYRIQLEKEIRFPDRPSQQQRNLYLGHTQTYTIQESEIGKDIKMALPVVSMYFHRGQALKNLSLYEYCATIQVKKWPESETNRSQWFPFEGGYHLQARYGQTLCAKQKTLIFKGAAPVHPGKRPQSKSKMKHKTWRKKADKYACYMLTMFRPSNIYKGAQHSGEETKQGYKWKHLKKFVSTLQQDEFVISKCRLMAMDRRMNTLMSDYESTKLLSAYRFRETDQWTDVEKSTYKRNQHLQQFYERQTDLQILQDYEFEAKYDKLDNRATIVANEMNEDATSFANAATFGGERDKPQEKPNVAMGKEIVDPRHFGQWDEKAAIIYDETNNESRHDERNSAKVVQKWTPQQMQKQIAELNEGQNEIVQTYMAYLTSVNTRCINPPPGVVLLTGKGGTGKSHVIDTLLEIGRNDDATFNSVWTMATNNLNASDINGSTIASILKQAIENPKKEKQKGKNSPRISQKALSQLDQNNVQMVKLLVIDEISNVTASKLGQLSRLFAHAMQKPSDFFGGIPVLLVGDFNQKEPVGGTLATTTVIDTCQSIADNSKEGLSKEQIAHERTIREIFDTKEKRTNSIVGDTDLNDSSDASHGCKILQSARWFELTKAERSKDNNHNKQVDAMYQRKPIEPSNFRSYQLYNEATLSRDSPQEILPWLRAPVIVKTNRERITINYDRALDYAKRTNKLFIRWPSNYSQWEGKPKSNKDIEDTIATDSAFWEIFVQDGPCYLTDTISKKRKLCNGTRAWFHSVLLDESQKTSLDGQLMSGHRVITLQTPPEGINIRIDDEKVLKSSDWKDFELHGDAGQPQRKKRKKAISRPIIIPIRQGSKYNRDKPMFVNTPNLLVGPSRVITKQTYAIQGAFAITVDKAQGQTLDRVILALSDRKHRLSKFTYSCVYVGTSRVRKTKHMRILLKKRPNPRLEWETLNYLTTLRPNKSIEAYFAGFNKDRKRWKTDVWNKTSAFEAISKRGQFQAP